MLKKVGLLYILSRFTILESLSLIISVCNVSFMGIIAKICDQLKWRDSETTIFCPSQKPPNPVL